MKRENNKKFKKRKRNQNRSLTCRVLSMMFAIVLFCSTVLINTDYVSQASSFNDMVDMVEVEEDSAAADTSEDTGDDLDTDVNFESESEEGSAETYSESDDFGSSDADFSSGENMFTDGTSESSAPAEEAAQPVSCIVNLKNETIEVKAEAPAGVLPNGTQMIVKAVENNTEDAELTDQYNKLAAKITEQLQSQGKNLDGFLAYNVSFTDADGNPVEPSDKVTYSFTYKEASSPELTDPAASTVTAAMIRTNKETSELELTELKAEEDKLTVETNESRQLTKAAFQSAATAAYTFVWSSTPVADDNENNENKEENGEVNNEEVNTDTNTENTEENGEDTNTENNVENSEEEQNPEEAPDQEQIKMIRVIADEVNLRVTPSTEAEVIATVDTDTQLPLIETVTGEDEFTWYKVSYEEAQAYVRSDMEEGMYLVIGAAESSVKVTPMLLTVPFASTEEGWIYDVQAYPKAEKSNTAGIIVEKRLYRINPNTFELDEITADDATYKVGLFLDKDGTIPYGDDYIRTIHIQNAQSGKASYSNVLRGTYYVFELDENNKAIKLNDEVQIDKENSFHYNVTNAADKEDNSVVVDDNTVATDIAAYVNNIFSTLPEGFFVNGKIEITKNVVVDGVKKTVDDKFYATVFDDSGKAVSTVELKQNDKVTVTVPFSEDIKDTVTYAVKETDKDGNVLDKDSFAYVVSGEGSVKLNESDQYHGSIEITNTKKDAAVTPGGSNGGSGTSNGGSDASSHGGSATSRPVKTGDPMNPVFWGLVLLVSVIVIAGGVVVYKKRKQK